MKVPSTQSQTAMKTDRKRSPSRASEVADDAKARAARASHKGGKAERVQVSKGARALHEARRPEEPDRERIERLRAALEDGSFEIDADRIAERMIEEELG